MRKLPLAIALVGFVACGGKAAGPSDGPVATSVDATVEAADDDEVATASRDVVADATWVFDALYSERVTLDVALEAPAQDAAVEVPTQDALPPLDIAEVESPHPDVALPGECESAEGGFQPAGTACDGGVCTGAGRCGQCEPGAKRCTGNTPQTCSAEGSWISGASCLGQCVEVACTGCLHGATVCRGKTLQACDPEGHFVATTCPHTCANGACSGECDPGTVDCAGDAARTCSAVGQWLDGGACDAASGRPAP